MPARCPAGRARDKRSDGDARYGRLYLSRELGVDRARPGGELFGGDAFVALTSEEDGFIAGLDIGDIGDVGHAHVHADAASDRGAVASDEDVREVRHGAVIAVVIADGKHDDPRRMRRLIGAAIADHGACRDRLDLRDDGFPGQGWAEIDVFAEKFCAHVAFGGRPHAVAGDAGADELAMRVRPEDACGGVRDRADGGAEAVGGQDVVVLVENAQLLVGERVVGRVLDVGEMRAGALKYEVWEPLDVSDEFECLGDAQALSLRAGLELDDASHLLGNSGARCAERVDLRLVVDHRADVERDGCFGVHWRYMAHDEEIAVIAVIAQVLSLVQRIDAEPCRAALDERAPRDLDIMTVGVRLDDSRDLRAWRKPFLERLHVVGERRRVDQAAAPVKSGFLR